jgi:flavin reductase (DIM6/NTAB) family NADH-FMN oxidoreductase RutF
MLLGGSGKRERMSPLIRPNTNLNASWACLRDSKSYSRLLYANPVCLLLTGPRSCAFAAHRKVMASSPGTLGAVSPDAAGAPCAASLDAAGAPRAASPGAGAPCAASHSDRDNAMASSPGTLGAVSPDAAGAPRAASIDAAGAPRAASPGAGAPRAASPGAGAPRAASLDAAGAPRAASPGAGAPRAASHSDRDNAMASSPGTGTGTGAGAVMEDTASGSPGAPRTASTSHKIKMPTDADAHAHAHVDAHSGRDNAMVISWLSPVNNRGTLMLSINRKRHSSAWVLQRRCFALAVATTELEDALLRVGACSGKDTDKLGGDAPLVRITTVPLTAQSTQKHTKKHKGCRHTEIHVVAGSVALLHCHVTQLSANVDEQHWVIFAQVQACYADQRYWNGTVLAPINKHLPKLISFLGSQRFAAIDATDNHDAATDDHD